MYLQQLSSQSALHLLHFSVHCHECRDLACIDVNTCVSCEDTCNGAFTVWYAARSAGSEAGL